MFHNQKGYSNFEYLIISFNSFDSNSNIWRQKGIVRFYYFFLATGAFITSQSYKTPIQGKHIMNTIPYEKYRAVIYLFFK